MTILTVNTGSSSVRLAAFTCDGRLKEVANTRHDLSARDPKAMLSKFRETHGLAQIRAAAHRVVHGGGTLTTSCLIDDQVEHEIDRLSPLAPLHNPAAVAGIDAASNRRPAKESTGHVIQRPLRPRHRPAPAASG